MLTLANDGYLVSAISPGDIKGTDIEARVTHHPIDAPTELFWQGNRLFFTLRASWQRLRNARHVERILENLRPDIVLCSEPDSWAIAVKARRRWGCRVVVDLQEFYEDRAMAAPKGLRSPARFLIRQWMRHLSSRSDLSIHVSEVRQRV